MSKIGEKLQEKRESLGLTLEEVSNKLRIRVKYLEAIEEDKDGIDVPSAVYMLGYLKVYSDFLGLNGKAITTKLKTHAVDMGISLPSADSDDNKPSTLILLLSFILVVTIFLSWSKLINEQDILSEPSSIVSELSNFSNENNYLLTDKPLNAKAYNGGWNIKDVNFSDYNNNFKNYPDKLVLVAKASAFIKVIDAQGIVISNYNIEKNKVYLVPYEEGILLSISKKDAVEIFNKGKLFKTRFNNV